MSKYRRREKRLQAMKTLIAYAIIQILLIGCGCFILYDTRIATEAKTEQITLIPDRVEIVEGISIGRHLMNLGVKNLIMVDRFGAIYAGKPENNQPQEDMAKITNPCGESGTLAQAIRNADVFVGVSAPGVLTEQMVSSMAKDAVVFPMANPTPEIMPELAKAGGARVVGTGRSDYPNQINNVLAFPGIFRGALDCRASCINEEMKMATSKALAAIVSDDELCEDYIIPAALDKRVARVVADAVIKAAKETGVARV